MSKNYRIVSIGKSRGAAGALVIGMLLVVSGFSFYVVSQQAKDQGNISNAMDVAGREEAKSLAMLDEGTHKWLDIEYNRQRLWEYDTRYEIPMDEMIENNWLLPDFASRFNDIGESVYGLTYTTSVIRRDVAGDDDEFNVLTTIGERGVYPPETPPIRCPIVYDHLDINGNSRLAGGAVALEGNGIYLPYEGSCTEVNGNTTRTWLLDNANWNRISNRPSAVPPFGPLRDVFTCSVVITEIGNHYNLGAASVAPMGADGYIRCMVEEEPGPPVVNNDCIVRLRYTIDGVPAPRNILNWTWANVHVKTYPLLCSALNTNIVSTHVRGNVDLLVSTAGIPFGSADPTCVRTSNYMSCVFNETTGGGGGPTDPPDPPGADPQCDVWVWDEVLGRYVLSNTHDDTDCYGRVP